MAASVLKCVLCILFLDYISANPVVSVSEDRAAPFTGGYEYYENLGYYKLYSLPSTWGYAWRQCMKDGGHLAVIDSEEEHQVVTEILKESNENAYIGVHDFFFSRSFFTVTGKPLVLSSYNKWNDYYQPGRYSNNHCVLMNTDGEMLVDNCDEEFSFICEFEFN